MPGGKEKIQDEGQRLQEREHIQTQKAGLKEKGEQGAQGMQEQTEIMYDNPNYKGSGKLKGKVALIGGGATGIGRSVAIFFAREGADVAVIYHNDDKGAEETKKLVEKEGKKCLLLCGDMADSKFCHKAVQEVLQKCGKLDILVNHAGIAQQCHDLMELSESQFDHTMKNNVYSYFYLTKAALPHLKEGSCIINTTSAAAYKGDKCMVDYATSKGATKAWTYSLAQNLAQRKIRVNSVAPGIIATPMVHGSVGKEAMQKMVSRTLLGRVGQPAEVAPSYVFLASEDASYVTGQTLHPNGGIILNV